MRKKTRALAFVLVFALVAAPALAARTRSPHPLKLGGPVLEWLLDLLTDSLPGSPVKGGSCTDPNGCAPIGPGGGPVTNGGSCTDPNGCGPKG